MSFADWKKRSERYRSMISRLQTVGKHDVAEVCHAAYKAGERQGRKDAEAVAMNAVKLRELIPPNLELTGGAPAHETKRPA